MSKLLQELLNEPTPEREERNNHDDICLHVHMDKDEWSVLIVGLARQVCKLPNGSVERLTLLQLLKEFHSKSTEVGDMGSEPESPGSNQKAHLN